GGRFGYAALERLKTTQTGERAQYVRETADRAMRATNRFQQLSSPEIAAANIALHPADAKLPPAFLAQDCASVLSPAGSLALQSQPGCLRGQRSECDAWMKDLDGDGKDEIIVLERNTLWAYRLDAEARWQVIGNWLLPNACSSVLSEMQAGNFTTPRP